MNIYISWYFDNIHVSILAELLFCERKLGEIFKQNVKCREGPS